MFKSICFDEYVFYELFFILNIGRLNIRLGVGGLDFVFVKVGFCLIEVIIFIFFFKILRFLFFIFIDRLMEFFRFVSKEI